MKGKSLKGSLKTKSIENNEQDFIENNEQDFTRIWQKNHFNIFMNILQNNTYKADLHRLHLDDDPRAQEKLEV